MGVPAATPGWRKARDRVWDQPGRLRRHLRRQVDGAGVVLVRVGAPRQWLVRLLEIRQPSREGGLILPSLGVIRVHLVELLALGLRHAADDEAEATDGHGRVEPKGPVKAQRLKLGIRAALSAAWIRWRDSGAGPDFTQFPFPRCYTGSTDTNSEELRRHSPSLTQLPLITSRPLSLPPSHRHQLRPQLA
jgi:hypothetical protein